MTGAFTVDDSARSTWKHIAHQVHELGEVLRFALDTSGEKPAAGCSLASRTGVTLLLDASPFYRGRKLHH
jgi:hypothetical protein